jgi:PII-like signaling protein
MQRRPHCRRLGVRAWRDWRHRHDAGFFELAGELPVVVEFFVDAAMADQLLKTIAEAERNWSIDCRPKSVHH